MKKLTIMLFLSTLATIESTNAIFKPLAGSLVGGVAAFFQYKKYRDERERSLLSVDAAIEEHEKNWEQFKNLENKAEANGGTHDGKPTSHYAEKRRGDESWIRDYKDTRERIKEEVKNDSFNEWMKRQPAIWKKAAKDEIAFASRQLRWDIDKEGWPKIKEFDTQIKEHRKKFNEFWDDAIMAKENGETEKEANLRKQYEEQESLMEELRKKRSVIQDRIENSTLFEALKTRLFKSSN